MRTLLSILAVVWCGALLGQSDTLKQDYYFRNGVYLSFEDFQRNEPTYGWGDLDAEAHIDAAEHLVRFSEILVMPDRTPIDPSTIWGVSIEGKPYINILPVKGEEKLRSKGDDPILFVRLQAVGKLCYFYYEGYVDEMVTMNVYHPYTGKKLYSSEIRNQKAKAFKKVLAFETGELHNYNLENFLQLAADDKALVRTLEELTPNEAREKLYKSLFIYNDRNPVLVQTIRN